MAAVTATEPADAVDVVDAVDAVVVPLGAARDRAIDRLQARMSTTCGTLNRVHGELVDEIAEALRLDLWQQGGINSPEHWVKWQTGVSHAHAKELVRLARRIDELPVCASELRSGRASLDQLDVVARHVPAAYDAQIAGLVSNAMVSQLQRVLPKLPYDNTGDERDGPTAAARPARRGTHRTRRTRPLHPQGHRPRRRRPDPPRRPRRGTRPPLPRWGQRRHVVGRADRDRPHLARHHRLAGTRRPLPGVPAPRRTRRLVQHRPPHPRHRAAPTHLRRRAAPRVRNRRPPRPPRPHNPGGVQRPAPPDPRPRPRLSPPGMHQPLPPRHPPPHPLGQRRPHRPRQPPRPLRQTSPRAPQQRIHHHRQPGPARRAHVHQPARPTDHRPQRPTTEQPTTTRRPIPRPHRRTPQHPLVHPQHANTRQPERPATNGPAPPPHQPAA